MHFLLEEYTNKIENHLKQLETAVLIGFSIIIITVMLTSLNEAYC